MPGPLSGLPVDQLANFGSSITIAELDPAGPGWEPRQVVLYGPGQPFMGAEWGTTLQVKTKWYPGNPQATQQVLGPQEMPSQWEGAWRRTLMGKAPSIYIDETGLSNQIVSPHILREVVEDIQRRGMRLRVTWAVRGRMVVGDPNANGSTQEENVQILRDGRLTEFTCPIDRHTDIRWRMKFEWSGRGDQTARVASTRDDQALGDIANAIIASTAVTGLAINAKLRSIKDSVRKSADTFSLGQLEALASAPQKLVSDFTTKLQANVSTFKRIGDIAKRLRAEPFQIANSVVDFARNTTAVANQFVDAMGRRPPEQLTLKTRVADILRAQRYFGQTSDAAVVNARRGYELDVRMRQTLAQPGNSGFVSVRESLTTRQGLLIAVHVCKEGETPQRLSIKFYGDADHGPDILRANRLPLYTPRFFPAQILMIPALTNRPGGP